MANPADISDVTAVMERPLTPGETAAVPRWLDIAWRKLIRKVPALEARMDLQPEAPSHLAAADVTDVLVAMVERKLRNPDGRRQWGDDTYNETVDTEISSGKIYVTDEEIDQLAPAAQMPDAGVYSMQLER